ncbi:hypothetical protein SUGI_1007100 [Cryptomeria japonica]|nr:hypothetical protein SUGI_1007100 [Cryptomeria japonica]
MTSANDTETVKIDIHLSDEGSKINCAVRDEDGKPLLQCNIEPESWIGQVKETYDDPNSEYTKLETSPNVSIYRVPESIKRKKRGAYDPLVVFLGPYHHKKHQQLTAMDKYKLQAVKKTLQRIRGHHEKLTI